MNISPFAPARHELQGDVGVLVVNADGLDALDPTTDRPRTSARLSDLSEYAQSLVAEGLADVPQYSPYPDGIEWVERVVADRGMRVLARAAIGALTERQLVTMYPGQQQKKWWPTVAGERIGGPVVGLLVGSRKGDDVIDMLQVLKGHDTDTPGSLRGTLSVRRKLSLDFYDRTGKYADPEAYAAELARLASHDRVHVPDDRKTTDATIAALFSLAELMGVAQEYPAVSEPMARIIRDHMEPPDSVELPSAT